MKIREDSAKLKYTPMVGIHGDEGMHPSLRKPSLSKKRMVT